ncbi:MAG: outer membrane protein assembly factor BamA [Candidatus Omnitrophica bacterium]|nr:outer membrane protein assembly factor BamA [Candidatus Omnitrophota bacterium]
MKLLLRRYALFLAILLCYPSPSFSQTAPPPPTIHKIIIKNVGPPAASDNLVRANIRVKVGDPYTPASVDDDVRTLYSTGYFYNVRVVEDRTPEGVDLTYVLQGKPLLTGIQFVGNKKYSRAKLLKKISSKTGEPLDERKLFNDSQVILKMYQKAGYQKAKVRPVPNIDEQAGRGTVTFEIDEGPRLKIERVEFVGVHAFKEKKLRKVIKTRRHWMFSWLTGSGVLKEDQFDDDKEKLVDFYRNEGYIDFEIKDIKFDEINPKWMIIRFFVSEGRQYKVGKIDFKGNKLFTGADILKGVASGGKPIRPEMTVGKVFTPKGLAEDIEAIRSFYGSKGYIDTRIIAERNPNTETGTMDLVFEIEEGDKSYIEKIEIRGNTKTKDKVIRRELAVAPGEVFNMVNVDRSKGRLEQMNYFSKVEARPEPSDAGPNRKNLVVSVEEKNTGNLMVGAGFSTVDDIVGFVELSQGNFDLFNPPYFTGGGQKFRIRTQIGTQRQDYEITFIEPWFLGRKLALSVDLYYRELDFLSDYYNEREAGTRFGLTRALGSDYLIGGISYTLENIGLTDIQPDAPVAIKQEAGYSLVSKVGASIAYDTRNNAMLPDKGQRTEFLTELAGGPFGGDRDFYKLELRSAWYFKGFLPGHIIELTGHAGVVDAYSGDRVHLFDRWFLGGMYSLRGFKYRRAGSDETYDPSGEPLGGNTYWYGSAEYSIPIIQRLRFAVFYDIGNVYKDAYDFDFSDFLDDWGVGLRLNLPIGPLRFDYGIPIHTGRFTGNTGKFQFGVGYTREF